MLDQYAKFQLGSLKNKIFHEVAEGLYDVLLGVHLVPDGRLRHIFVCDTFCMTNIQNFSSVASKKNFS